MVLRPEEKALRQAMLDPEWTRIHELVALAEAARTGDALDEGFSDRFEALNAAVAQARNAGSWADLAGAFPPGALAPLNRLDLDLMALALAPVARPALGPRFLSLQPQAGTAWPGLPLVQELLMLADGAEVGLLFERLHPAAPLVALGLIRVEGMTPSQVLRPGPQLIRALLHRDPELAPPPGATLSDRPGDWDDLVLPAPTMRRLADFSAWVHRARMLVTDWGARPIHGPLALFSGGSGTGKSFAASVIAQDLGRRTAEPWALYTLDLGGSCRNMSAKPRPI